MKKIASTLKNLDQSELWLRIMNPEDDLRDVVEQIKAHWAYDLYARRPGPALLENGVLKPTDLDLACFLAALVERKAVINLPSYQIRRPATRREGEHVVSRDNRHGHVLGLVSNKEAFSFSVRIRDMNVITTDGEGNDGVGAYRNFMLVDLGGHWHEGWRKIEFMPSRAENEFLTDRRLWTGNEVVFENFVHPNRWTSFFGQWYLLTKALIKRLRAEAAFRRQEVKDKLRDGLVMPKGEDERDEETYGASEEVGEAESIKILAFAADVDAEVPEVYAPYSMTPEGLEVAKKRAAQLTYVDIPELQFAVRATELAFVKRTDAFSRFAECDPKAPPLPEPLFSAWITGAKWEQEKVKRTVWNRLVLGQQRTLFTRSLSLRCRVYWKTERVAAGTGGAT
jgi:hypothetical protein